MPQEPTPIVTESREAHPAPQWCNCYDYVKARYPSFPRTAELKPNTTPHTGAVAIFDYPHYAIIGDMDAEGFWTTDANWGGCGIHTHYLRWDNPHLMGFWAANPSDM